MKKSLLFTIILAFLGVCNVNAQLLSVKEVSVAEAIKPIEANNTNSDWSIFTDGENRMVYIDFEKINVNLSSVNLKDADGKVVFKDETLWQLPVNTIYEIDFSKYPKGGYTVELKTFTSTLKKSVHIN